MSTGLDHPRVMRVPAFFSARSTAMRLTLRYLFGYLLALLVALAALSYSNTVLTDQRAKSLLQTELIQLTGGLQSPVPEQVQLAITARLGDAKKTRQLYLLVGPDAKKLAGNVLAWPSESEILADGKVHTVEIEQEVLPGAWFDDDVFLPVLAIEFAGGHRLLVSRAIAQARILQATAEFLSEGLPLAILLALTIGLSLAYSVLRRIRLVSDIAAEIMAGDLSRRIAISPRADEFDALAENLNAMLARIQQLIKGMRDVTDNVAHDLRSPLTRLRSQLEICLLEPRSAEEYRSAIALGVEETKGLVRTFNALLEIAQADAGQLSDPMQRLDLYALAQDVVELYAPLAEEHALALALLPMPHTTAAHIHGSRNLLAQALGNLLENAVKFTPAGGRILLSIRVNAAAVELQVSDTGPGIALAERSRVLGRFVRLESARQTPGNGLGLSLVNAVAKMHHAELHLSDTRVRVFPGSHMGNQSDEQPGLTVTLRFVKQIE